MHQACLEPVCQPFRWSSRTNVRGPTGGVNGGTRVCADANARGRDTRLQERDAGGSWALLGQNTRLARKKTRSFTRKELELDNQQRHNDDLPEGLGMQRISNNAMGTGILRGGDTNATMVAGAETNVIVANKEGSAVDSCKERGRETAHERNNWCHQRQGRKRGCQHY